MKTFLAWVIANIGGVMLVPVFIIYEILLFTGHLFIGTETDFVSMAILLPILIVLLYGILGGSPSKGFIGDLMNCICMAIVYILTYFIMDSPEYSFLTIYFWGIIPAAIIALLAAGFTAVNMDEVVSRRMMYINSQAEMFEVTLLYTFNRFVATFSAIGYVFLMIALYNKYSM